MENASKALIIAGAILLSILLISLGLMVYNQAKDTIGSVNLSQQEIEAFNSKFTSYEGTNISGSQVNSLIQTVMASNQSAIDDSTGAYVAIRFDTVKNSKTYHCCVGVSADDKFGVYQEEGGDFTNNTKTISDLLDYNKNNFRKRNLDYLLVGCLRSSYSAPLKVTNGKKYSVEIGYEDGRVAAILVK